MIITISQNCGKYEITQRIPTWPGRPVLLADMPSWQTCPHKRHALQLWQVTNIIIFLTLKFYKTPLMTCIHNNSGRCQVPVFCMYNRDFTNFEITLACGKKFHWYLRALSLKFHKAKTKIEVFLSLPSLAETANRAETGKLQFCL